MNCPFCEIDCEKNKIIDERKYIRVIFSNPRLVPGHILVVPKRHVEKLSELKPAEKEELLNTVIEWQENIISKFSAGCDIRQNYRPFQKQDRLKVNHLHIHLQPRDAGDKLYSKCQIFEKEIFKDLTQVEIKKNIKKLKL